MRSSIVGAIKAGGGRTDGRPGCRYDIAGWSTFITIIVVYNLRRRGKNVRDSSIPPDFRGIPVLKSDNAR